MAPTEPAPRATLALVLDRARMAPDVRAQTRDWVRAGVDWLQIRERNLGGSELLDFTRAVVSGAREARGDARVVVNRRIDVALAAGADGVHLGFDALGVEQARALMGVDAWIGVSCHAREDVRRAARAGADYVHLAPLFDPISKPAERPALGLDALREIAALGPRVLGQGGLTPQRVREVVGAGAAGIAVTGAVLMADDPSAAIAELRAALDQAACGSSTRVDDAGL